MSRIQLALNVSNLDEAIAFYSKFFKSEPAKVRPGYANFAIEEPSLKLVLIQNEELPGSLNHLGVEVFSSDEVVDSTMYLAGLGLATHVEEKATCCFAVQDKVWVEGVDNLPWEIYTVLDDATSTLLGGDDTCCVSATADAIASTSTTMCC
jgi:catechol 2,3-dioxygenase-like lactoylglutathione lyase family enzyme